LLVRFLRQLERGDDGVVGGGVLVHQRGQPIAQGGAAVAGRAQTTKGVIVLRARLGQRCNHGEERRANCSRQRGRRSASGRRIGRTKRREQVTEGPLGETHGQSCLT